MKKIALATAALIALAAPAFAEGDAEAGAKDFNKCKSCHTIASADEVIVKGGKTGPNLYGVVGRVAGSADFKYSKDMMALGETGFTWTEEDIVAFVADPTGWLREATGNAKARSKMTFKLADASNVAAYLASLAPAE